MDITTYLKESGLTQMAFARMLGVTQGTVAFWLHNKPPTIERCIEIEKATGGKVTCEELRPDVDWAYLRGVAPAGEHAPRSRCRPLPASGEGVTPGYRTAGPDSTAAQPAIGAQLPAGVKRTAAGDLQGVA